MTAATIHTVAAVIRDAQGRVLLVRKRGTPTFIQPGGKREPGEAPADELGWGARLKNSMVPPRLEVEAVPSAPAPWLTRVVPILSAMIARLMCRPLVLP